MPSLPPIEPARPGDVLGGKYRIVAELGRGGMGVVYKAEHLRLGEPVAIKTLLPQALAAHGAVERFDREARAAAKLKSPHVARVIDIDQHGGLPYIVLEFLEGHNLAHELDERGPLPWEEVVPWALQVCAAMDEAHRKGIVHRDLKPSNLFLAVTDQGRTLKVLDFGISKVTEPGPTDLTMTTMALGTVLYMSPEHVRSAKQADARSDVWSLGAILYELLTNQPPFTGESAHGIAAAIIADPMVPLSHMRPDLPHWLVDAIHGALTKDRQQRIQSMAAFAEALQGRQPTGPIPIPPSISSSRVSEVAPSSTGSGLRSPSFHTSPGVAHTMPGEVDPPTVLMAPIKPRRWPLAAAVGAGLALVVGLAAVVLGGRDGGAGPTGDKPLAIVSSSPSSSSAPPIATATSPVADAGISTDQLPDASHDGGKVIVRDGGKPPPPPDGGGLRDGGGPTPPPVATTQPSSKSSSSSTRVDPF